MGLLAPVFSSAEAPLSSGSLPPVVTLSDTEQAWLKAHPVVRFGVSEGFAPFNFRSDSGEFQGIAVDYLRLFVAKTGIQMRIDTIAPWGTLMKLVEDRAIDGVLIGARSSARDRIMTFTREYYVAPWVLVTRADEPAFNLRLDNLGSRRVSVLIGSPNHDRLVSDSTVHVVGARTVEEIWQGVSSGDADVGLSNIVAAEYYIAHGGIENLKISGILDEKLHMGAGIRKDWPELVAILNRAIGSITPSEAETIRARWLASRLGEERVRWSQVRRWFLALGLFFAAFLVAAFLWNLRLQREIDDRKRAEEALRLEKAFADRLFDVPRDTVCLFDPATGRPLRWNKRSTEVSGYSDEELAGMAGFHQLHPPEDLPKARDAVARVLAGGEAVVQMELIAKTGERIPFEYSVNVVRSLDGKPLILTVGRDISERLQAIQERERRLAAEEVARIEAENAVKARDEFILVAAHDLKTPLAALRITVEGLQGRPELTAEATARGIEMVARQTQRMIRLVNGLMDIARIKSGRFDLHRIPADLVEVFRSVLRRMEPAIENAGSKVEIEGEEYLPALVDTDRMEQVFENLLSNAMKFAGKRPIEALAARSGGSARITIRDHGPGIPPGGEDRIFEIYDRGGGESHVGGLGIGLFVCRRIVDLHGGSITARNAADGGAVFMVEIPAGEDPGGRPDGRAGTGTRFTE